MLSTLYRAPFHLDRGVSWSYPGLPADPNNDLNLSRFHDALCERMPWVGIDTVLQLIRIAGSRENLFFSDTSNEIRPLAYETETVDFLMGSAGGAYDIDVDRIDEALPPGQLDQDIEALRQDLRRFLSVALIYGGFSNGGWRYFQTGGAIGWDVQHMPPGLHMLCTELVDAKRSGVLFNEDAVSAPDLSFENLEAFVAKMRSGSGEPDYLVMNSELRAKLRLLFLNAGIQPEKAEDPFSKRQVLAYDGIPILQDDYIMTYDNTSTYAYLSSAENPEKASFDTVSRTSMYAVRLGAEAGLFGLCPLSHGGDPIKVGVWGHAESNHQKQLRAVMTMGLAVRTRRCIGRWAYIDMTPPAPV